MSKKITGKMLKGLIGEMKKKSSQTKFVSSGSSSKKVYLNESKQF